MLHFEEVRQNTFSLSETGFPMAAKLSHKPLNMQIWSAMVLSSSLRRYVSCCRSVNSRSCESCAYEFLRASHTECVVSKPTASPRGSSESVPMIHPRRRRSDLRFLSVLV